jgi:hypothetical protein
MNFKETVLFCYDQKEFRSNWERLRKIKFSSNPKIMKLFIKDIKDLVWDRMAREI